MVEMVEKRVGQSCKIIFFLFKKSSCSYACKLYFLVKILLVKLNNLHPSACLNLNYSTTKHKAKM